MGKAMWLVVEIVSFIHQNYDLVYYSAKMKKVNKHNKEV